MMLRRRGWVIAVVVLVVVVPLLVAGIYLLRRPASRAEHYVPPPPEAPPDLARLRPTFQAGLDALQKKDGPAAVKHFSSIAFGKRAVEEYRLLFLAKGYEQAKNPVAQRTTLASLWARDPKLALRDETGATLAGLYTAAGDFTSAAGVSRTLAAGADTSASAAPARWRSLESSFATGDLASVLFTAQQLVVKNPAQSEAGDAIDIVRSLGGIAPDAPIHLTSAQRLERGLNLLRDGNPTAALEELNALDSGGLSGDLAQQLRLNRGLALSQLRQYEAANKLLEPLESGSYAVAIPALTYASRNYQALSASTNPFVIKTKVVRQKVGTVKVRVKGSKKLVTRPKYANVKKTTQLVDLAKKAKKAEYDRLAAERLKDLLTLPLPADVRVDTLNALIALAEAKNQDDYERELIAQLVKVDPAQDPGLQHFWDKAWAAYGRGDWTGARDLLGFIMDTYRSANVRRQARYWYARAGERVGKGVESKEMYQELADAPYEDVYVIYAAARGARKVVPTGNPLKQKRPDWTEIAERKMPAELRLAYELTALSDARDARAEIQRNRNRTNASYAEALLADLYNSSGDMMLMMRSLRHAYPQLGSVEQDSVPPYFLRMYHPTRYQEAIRKSANANALDPYLVMGLIHQESYYNPKARSAVGATGLMQLMPATGKELAQRLGISPNLENPEINIRLGTFHFRQLVNLFGGNTQLAVASYNAGQGNVAKWRRAAPNKPNDEFLESIPFPETRTYVKRVTVLASSYRRLDQQVSGGS
jgi:soluble lytic murein transglycosylase-like protein